MRIIKNKKHLPKLNELVGIDKYTLTNPQRNDCILLANHYSCQRAVEQAKIFHYKNLKDTK